RRGWAPTAERELGAALVARRPVPRARGSSPAPGISPEAEPRRQRRVIAKTVTSTWQILCVRPAVPMMPTRQRSDPRRETLRSEAMLPRGRTAVEKAGRLAATPREKDYIPALATFYRDSDKLDHRTRAVTYEKAMEQVSLRYPEDREAAVFYALALDATAPPTDKTYANQLKAAAILEKVFVEQPNHPGVAHYIIHS